MYVFGAYKCAFHWQPTNATQTKTFDSGGYSLEMKYENLKTYMIDITIPKERSVERGTKMGTTQD